MPLTFDQEQLRRDLVRDEALRLRPYDDKTGKELRQGDTLLGKLSIGVGHNLTDLGISEKVAWFLLEEDIHGKNEGSAKVIVSLSNALPWWLDLDPVRQRAVANLAFNLGVARLLGFRKALVALRGGQYARAADEFLDSLWARQVGARAKRVTDLIRNG